ncbi:hypothetical protein AURANDRAFT_66362 [Aureococcus anophagefferens]|uniref:Sulfotransferase domain-containing protein n=1 Tax=Aureococcus anophagefferens TaxID=44056 RepID=F0YH97_AURAN|nr:hypothetical protein AURANDRAFT_66362 [Aureococcus anophagefferens]EGB05407.1 hypothetical protein AURANDRAFT_66362 [Aureococcus anophagefferens]|eukprot:XP_009039792.1 hypothetical protein AURANDRAFT_66362 [Aureococcus anophagefferens]
MSRSVVVVVAWWLASPAAAKRWRAPEREPGLPLALVVGLPKMGTTSLRNYFHCSGYRASHMACSNGPHCGALGVRRGPDALGDQTRLFRKLCGDFDAFTQLDSVTTTGCVAPQVSHLAALVKALPSACFVLNTRPLDAWLASVRAHVTAHRYANWSMYDRMVANCPVHPRNGAGLAAWAARHVERATALVERARCGVVVDIEGDVRAVGARLAAKLNGTHARCWGQANARPRPPAPARRRLAAAAAGGRRAGARSRRRGPFEYGAAVDDARFAARPRLCRYRGAPASGAVALLSVASDLGYLFFHWPYVVNAAAYAARFGLAFHLWVGELPAALAASAGPICLRSRWREGAGFGGPNSNHYNKVLAAAALLDRPGVPGVLFRDVDMFAPAGGGGARDPRDLHEHGRVDAAFPCTSKIDRAAPRRKRGGPPRGFRLKSTKIALWYHTERPSLNYVFRRCAAFRFACGRQFVMPEVVHEGHTPRADGANATMAAQISASASPDAAQIAASPGGAVEDAALADYESEMRASREELLKKIARSSEDIAGRCRDAMEQSKENVSASLFDDEERARVVEAYAAKLKASREEMVAKVEAQQAEERRRLVEDLKADVSGVVDDVVAGLRDDLAGAYAAREAAAREAREASAKAALDAHAAEVQDFNRRQLAELRDAMARHRDDALARYERDMAAFRDDQLAELGPPGRGLRHGRRRPRRPRRARGARRL